MDTDATGPPTDMRASEGAPTVLFARLESSQTKGCESEGPGRYNGDVSPDHLRLGRGRRGAAARAYRRAPRTERTDGQPDRGPYGTRRPAPGRRRPPPAAHRDGPRARG